MSDPPADARAFPATTAEPLRREFLAPTVLAIGGVGLWSVADRFLSKAIFLNCQVTFGRGIGRATIPVEVTRAAAWPTPPFRMRPKHQLDNPTEAGNLKSS